MFWNIDLDTASDLALSKPYKFFKPKVHRRPSGTKLTGTPHTPAFHFGYIYVGLKSIRGADIHVIILRFTNIMKQCPNSFF